MKKHTIKQNNQISNIKLVENPAEPPFCRSAKIYVVSLQKNKGLAEYYNKNEIRGGNFVEILKKEEFSKISDGDMIYFLSSRDISKETKEEIQGAGRDWNIKIAVCPKKLKNLNDACSTYVKTDRDYKRTHSLLKEIVECISLPSLVSLDYADIRQLFMMSSRIVLRKYKSKLSEKDDIIKEIKREFKKIDGCFVVISGGVDMTLEDVSNLGEIISMIAKHICWGARVEDNLKGKIELSLFAGWRK